MKVHWVLPKVPDELLIRQFERFGRVQRVVREGWRNPGLTHMTGTTRVFHVAPTTPTSLEALPHQATINGSPILIEVAGRPSLCLRCHHTGHYRKNCITPWCRTCRAYGHDQTGCTQSYAARAKQRTPAQNLEEFMDAEEMAAMLNVKEPPQPTTLAPPHAPSPPFEERMGQPRVREGETEENKGHEQEGPQARDVSEPNVLAETASSSEPLPAAVTADDHPGSKATQREATERAVQRPRGKPAQPADGADGQAEAATAALEKEEGSSKEGAKDNGGERIASEQDTAPSPVEAAEPQPGRRTTRRQAGPKDGAPSNTGGGGGRT